ncbi:hypothetical protein N9H82_03525 [Flavobacteriaceae bacterium]|nr:hypothetical protein [Flavobacteriaceae bacterium]
MKEWFKKHLGLVGFGVGMVLFLIELLWRFILKIDHYDLAEIGFVLWIEAAFVQGILNEKYSEKVKNGIIVFNVAISIGLIYYILD